MPAAPRAQSPVVAAPKAAAPKKTVRKPTWAAPVGEAQLGEALSSILDRSVRSGSWGVLVVSLSRGDTLFGYNPDSALLPASTMKVFTSAMALDYLGPDHQFQTQVFREGDVDSAGAITGDLVLRGAGDPSLGVPSGADPMHELAKRVAAAGITRVDGAIVGDGTAFDGRHIPDGWLDRFLGAKYAARVSALSYNENIVRVVVRVVNGRAQVSFAPAVSGLPVSVAVSVKADSRSGAIAVRQDSATGAFRVSGWIGGLSPARGYMLMIENPEMFAAAAFRSALIAEGVKVTGPVRSRQVAPGAARVAELPSRTLSDLITQMNGESNNHFAELLFRNVAASTGTVGSADSGNALLHTFLSSRVGTAVGNLNFADGSGLSTLDRVTPRSLVSVLDYSSKAPWASVFQNSLPVAGQTETLRARMRNAPAQGRLRAKTGSTGDVRSLGGYVTTASGEELVFAFIYNGGELDRAKATIDAMGSTLASFAR
ncbi:MAG TPA: D-alanyl-D-alanine carboxypeptidase/D-alanyl-D-alanine-endopeptidase [Gemmatimonadaceae bacterium]|nr:D-alanyl-D-alanine carboxypeptidase/D-alanyl-D-alanine-endopeptidase [Gemmatimonadaceae bacterium]